jgi:hypothetical protein
LLDTQEGKETENQRLILAAHSGLFSAATRRIERQQEIADNDKPPAKAVLCVSVNV